jgi:hypothetical protein
MIDFDTEQVVSLSEATKIVPPRNGKRVAFTTLLRWTQRGIRGVKLESLRVGGTLCTSKEALQRFFAALSEQPQQATPSRQKRVDKAVAELTARGV